jgi:TfoX C-terminal domain
MIEPGIRRDSKSTCLMSRKTAICGSVRKYQLVIRGIARAHRMLLYALGGALLDIDCNKLPRDIKRTLEEEASLD